MVDGPPGPLTTSDRLQLLLDRRRRWRTLDWTQKTMVPVPGACQAYELVGGVFAKSMGVAHLTGSHHLNATWLPSRTEGARSIIREDLGVATRDFAIDPTQDLIALVDGGDRYSMSCCILSHQLTALLPPDCSQHADFRIRVYLRTISTNLAHPRATSSELLAPISFELSSSFIQIVDDVIGMFFWVHGPGLIIWNWLTSEILVVRSSSTLQFAAIQCLCSHVQDWIFPKARGTSCSSPTGPFLSQLPKDPDPSVSILSAGVPRFFLIFDALRHLLRHLRCPS